MINKYRQINCEKEPLSLSPRSSVLTFDLRRRLGLRKYRDCGRSFHMFICLFLHTIHFISVKLTVLLLLSVAYLCIYWYNNDNKDAKGDFA